MSPEGSWKYILRGILKGLLSGSPKGLSRGSVMRKLQKGFHVVLAFLWEMSFE